MAVIVLTSRAPSERQGNVADIPARSTGVVQLTLREGVDIKDVHDAIEKLLTVLKPQGCITCGLGGIDIVIRPGDPVFFEEVSRVMTNKAVLSISRAAQVGVFAE